MSIHRLIPVAMLLCLSIAVGRLSAAPLPLGSPAPAFTKNVLNSDPWPTATLSQFRGKALILHVLGYD